MAKSIKEQARVKPKTDVLRQEIRELSSKLKELGIEKETCYKEKIDLDKKLNSLIKTAKDLRAKKIKIDENIKSLKVKREKSNNELKTMFSTLSAIKQKLGIGQKHGPRESLDDIRKQIEAIQFTIQTEALSFDREKKYMEQIKKLKVKIKDLGEEEAKFIELTTFKKKLKKKKDEADSVHDNIQKIATESSGLFKDLTEYSKNIANTKKQKNSLQKKLKNLKIQIDKLNQNLGTLLKDWSEISSKSPIIPDKTKTIMDKFKKKKRLTTDDILMLQRRAIRR